MKKKILFVVDNLKMGGVTKVLSTLLKEISTIEDYSIDLLVLHYYEDMAVNIPESVKIIKGSKAFSLIDQNISTLIKEKNLLKLLKKAWFSFKIKSGLIKYTVKNEIKRQSLNNYDIEIAFGDGFPYVFTSYGNTPKKIAWMHSDVLVQDYSARYFERMKSALGNFDLGVAVSDKVAESYMQKYGVKNIVTIHNIMNVGDIISKSCGEIELPFNKENLNLISVGRLDYSKNYEMLIRVIKKLVDQGFNPCLYLIGDGDEKEALEAQISELDLKDNVFLLGRKDNPYPYVKSADAFLLSSRFEGLPTVLYEAIILNIPCVSTKVAGANEILSDKYGIVTENNEQAFYEGVKTLFTDNKKLEEFKNNLKEYRYDVKPIIDKIKLILS